MCQIVIVVVDRIDVIWIDIDNTTLFCGCIYGKMINEESDFIFDLIIKKHFVGMLQKCNKTCMTCCKLLRVFLVSAPESHKKTKRVIIIINM